MMQHFTQSSGVTGNPPPFAHGNATGIDLMTTQSGAAELAARIVRAWALSGHTVDAWVIKLPNPMSAHGHGLQASWGVRTDLVNGMPSGLGREKWERKYGRGI